MTNRRDIPAWTWVVATALVIGLVVFGAVAWRAVTTEHADPVEAQNRFAAALAASSSKTPLIKRDSSGHWARPEGTLSRGSQPTHFQILAYRASEARMIKAEVPLWFLKIKGPAVNYALDGTGFHLATLGLTAGDLERAGAGVVIDETRTNGDRVLAWTY